MNGACHFTFPGNIFSSIAAAAERRAAVPGPGATTGERSKKATSASALNLEATTFTFKRTRIVVFVKPGSFKRKQTFPAVVTTASAAPLPKSVAPLKSN